MIYSVSAHSAGSSSGFFFDGDKNAPGDAIEVSDADHMAVINLPPGSTYSFSAASALTTASPFASFELAQAQATQISTLAQAYAAATATPVSYTSKGGIAKTYQADPGSVSNLQAMLLAFQASAAVPSGFYWVAADNTQVPFTYADLQGFAQAMGAQGFAAFVQLQTRKAQVKAASTAAAVQAIVW